MTPKHLPLQLVAKSKKYYVVWQGHQPGIYDSWENCQREIKGYPDAKFKSFSSMEEARTAFRNPDEVVHEPKKQYYYVIWQGHHPGIYESWDQAQKAIAGYPRALYKTFGSKQLAERAFKEGPENYREGDFKKTKDLDPQLLDKIGNPIELSLCVDAACNGKGDMEYQGVWTFSRDQVFKVGPYKKGSNNIGEFLALVHALAYLNQQRDEKFKMMPVYSDSKIAMGWIRAKKCFTKKNPSPEVQQLIHRAEKWLADNYFKNPLLKWETKAWGEIPADFGRK
jgi:ribonuclease HI